MQQRQCLILQGESLWLNEQALALYHKASDTQRLYLSDADQASSVAVPIKQATQYLGRELVLVVFDCCQPFSADALGAIIGSLKAGGALVLLLSNTFNGLWLARLIEVAADYTESIHHVKQSETLPMLALDIDTSKPTSVQPSVEQQQAIEAVLKVVSGHRRRPLLISSDRGRGKTALLGMAAAALLNLGKTKLLVTGPAKANSDALFEHANLALPAAVKTPRGLQWQDGKIEFVAPDLLLKTKPAADLLIVDEAAAIPLHMLEQLLQSYARVVFSSTLHGYEGTGRGFALAFKKTLDTHTPGWRSLSLTQPIRWADNDRLEKFSFDALLLNAEPVAAESVAEANMQNVQFEWLSREQLLANEALLRQVFGLMVLAHYRTRPSDLQMMLDRDDISIAVLRYQDNVVATVWLVDEPALDADLASKVFAGERRLKGQLLPQSLLAHAGLPDAGDYHYKRIIRIAVHPELHSKGLGSLLLTQLKQAMRGKTDLIGTSYAMDERVCEFWLKNGLKPVRLGQHLDQVTGSVSVLMLLPISGRGKVLFDKAEQSLSEQWPYLLQRQLKWLPVNQLICLNQAVLAFEQHVTDSEQLQIECFAYAQRSLESTEIALWKWLSGAIGKQALEKVESKAKTALMLVLMQQRDISDVVTSLGFNGRGELLAVLRQAVSEALSAASPVDTK
ncbi:putative P-loop ATPase [Methylophaga thiooxydans]|uniref:tRNA(Met) cytidine acetyltransferase TmcA n=1 Tax=Methylophaga thiooxydans TaxID=392484 RepID=A0A0A0BFK3_9GAMM|nr:GNAT family N-acetyltransferase [Methylophaga thiooxydans]KGM07293.1 putative P-loop ATPase [Methylophaga thiooxydans]